MKKIISAVLSMLVVASLILSAFAVEMEQEITYFEDGSYFVTVLEDESLASLLRSSTATKSKTAKYYSASGVAQWYVKVTGTFTYGDGISECTSSSVSAGSYVSDWRIASKSTSRKGSTATAAATANHMASGEVLQTLTKSVTLTCSSTGTFS